MTNIPTTFEVSISTNYEDMKGDANNCREEAQLSQRDREMRYSTCTFVQCFTRYASAHQNVNHSHDLTAPFSEMV